MASILLIGLDPETRAILKLRFEIDGVSVATALGSKAALPRMKNTKPDIVIVDLVDYDSGEMKEASAISKASGNIKSALVLLLPRGNFAITKPTAKICDFCGPAAGKSEPKADLVVKKPYDLNALIVQVKQLISNPKTSCSSRRGFRRRS